MASEEQEEKTSLPPEEEEVDVKLPVSSSESIGRKEVEIPDCPVHSVVVYPDRAEVCRVRLNIVKNTLSISVFTCTISQSCN